MFALATIVITVIVVLVLVLRGNRSSSHFELPIKTAPSTWKFASVFRRKQYLFDTTSEFNVFKLLTELFGDRFYVFPQINIGHLVEPRAGSHYARRANRSRIERKSVDFVLCDKVHIIPQLVIELDGSSHDQFDRQQRDRFVNELMKDVGLKIVHLRLGTLTRESIKTTIETALL